MISGFLHHVSLEQPVLLVSSLVPMISVMTEISSLASLFPGFHIDVQSKLGGGGGSTFINSTIFATADWCITHVEIKKVKQESTASAQGISPSPASFLLLALFNGSLINIVLLLDANHIIVYATHSLFSWLNLFSV